MEGTIGIETTSTGGGFGGSAGIGRGKGGIDVSYQGMDLDTAGTQTTRLAEEVGPPPMHDKYHEKAALLENCARAQADAVRARFEIDAFANDPEAVAPFAFFSDGCDKKLTEARSLFDWNAPGLRKVFEYEKQLALWERTRVCMRCAQCFVTEEDRRLAKATFEMPEFRIPLTSQRCPHCGTYQWKTAEAYFQAMTASRQREVDTAEKRLGWAQEAASEPNPGFWKKIARKLSDIPSLDDAKSAFATATKQLDAIKAAHEQGRLHNPDFCRTRVCSRCQRTYQLPDSSVIETKSVGQSSYASGNGPDGEPEF